MIDLNSLNIGPASSSSIAQAKQRFEECAENGFLRHAIAKSYGGTSTSFSQLASAHTALGARTQDPGLMLAINAHLWGAVFTILRFGSDIQRKTWLAPLLTGRTIGGHAITEPQAGSNTQMIECRYSESNDNIILNGHKRYITNTPIAGMMVVYAKNEASNALSAFIVKSTDKGANFKNAPTVEGCATATMGDIVLTNCQIQRTRLLGKAGAGGTMIQLALEYERAFIFAGIAGVMQWQLEQVVNHARTRVSGGHALGAHQAISHKIADMKTRLDTSELWIAHCAQLLDTGKRITTASAQTKLVASEAFLKNSLDTVHLLGASGLRTKLTKLVDDAMAGTLMSGTSEIQRNIIAAMIGLAVK